MSAWILSFLKSWTASFHEHFLFTGYQLLPVAIDIEKINWIFFSIRFQHYRIWINKGQWTLLRHFIAQKIAEESSGKSCSQSCFVSSQILLYKLVRAAPKLYLWGGEAVLLVCSGQGPSREAQNAQEMTQIKIWVKWKRQLIINFILFQPVVCWQLKTEAHLDSTRLQSNQCRMFFTVFGMNHHPMTTRDSSKSTDHFTRVVLLGVSYEP